MNLFGDPPDDLCGICMKPLKDGDAIYTIPDENGRQRHYECYEENGPLAKLKKQLAKTEALLKTFGRQPKGRR